MAERLAPPVAPEDDDPTKPLVAPKTITVAVALAILGGALYLFVGLASLMTTGTAIDSALATYTTQVAECQDKVGGIGDQVTATPSDDLKSLADKCKGYRQLTDADVASAKTQLTVTSIVVGLLGLVGIAAGWFLRVGAKWAKRVVMGLVALAFVGTLLLGLGSPLLLVGTLLLAVALMLTIVGKGGLYFVRVANRRRPA